MQVRLKNCSLCYHTLIGTSGRRTVAGWWINEDQPAPRSTSPQPRSCLPVASASNTRTLSDVAVVPVEGASGHSSSVSSHTGSAVFFFVDVAAYELPADTSTNRSGCENRCTHHTYHSTQNTAYVPRRPEWPLGESRMQADDGSGAMCQHLLARISMGVHAWIIGRCRDHSDITRMQRRLSCDAARGCYRLFEWRQCRSSRAGGVNALWLLVSDSIFRGNPVCRAPGSRP